MRYRSPRSHPANCRLPRRRLLPRLRVSRLTTWRLTAGQWRMALAIGLLLIAALSGGAWRLVGQEMQKLAQTDTSAISPSYQQMLVLRITTLCETVHFGGQQAEAPLRAATATLDRAHTALQRRLADGNRPSPEAIALYHSGPQSLDRAMQGFLTAVRRFLAARDTEAGELAYHRLQALAESTLPLRLNQLTDLIDARMAKQQQKLQRLQTIAAVTGTLALLLASLLGLRLWQRARAARAADPAPQSPPTMLTLNGVTHQIGQPLPRRAGMHASLRAVQS